MQNRITTLRSIQAELVGATDIGQVAGAVGALAAVLADALEELSGDGAAGEQQAEG